MKKRKRKKPKHGIFNNFLHSKKKRGSTKYEKYVKKVYFKVQYLQRQNDWFLPQKIKSTSKSLLKWEKLYAKTFGSDEVAQNKIYELQSQISDLYDQLDQVKEQLDFGSTIMSYVCDATLKSAQRQISKDNLKLLKAKTNFFEISNK